MNYKEVFKLAQDKGYGLKFTWSLENTEYTETSFDMDDLILCELTLIAKWLREQHKIHITIHLGLKLTYYWQLMDLSLQQDNTINTKLEYLPTYEAALLAGIKEALKFI